MNETSHINAFLAASVRALRRGQEFEWPSAPDFDQDLVWDLIELHGIALLLQRNRALLQNWPGKLLDKIAEEARITVLWESTHFDAVVRLHKAITNAGIESVMMKGTAIAYSLYDDPALRRRGDTDLLIHPKDKKKTVAILRDMGWYPKDDPHGLMLQQGWVYRSAGVFEHAVDLHWEPTERAVLHKLLPLDMNFANKQPIKRFARDAFRPDFATMAIHGVINQKWHTENGFDEDDTRIKETRRLIWSLDFDALSDIELHQLCANGWQQTASAGHPMVGWLQHSGPLGIDSREDYLHAIRSSRHPPSQPQGQDII